MKAAQIDEYGGKEVLKVASDAPKPKASEGQVLIEVYAAGVNPFDWKVREGFMKDFIPLNFPATLGGDFSGVVAEVGDGVNGIKVGDEVYGQANAAGGQGSYAEFTPVVTAQVSLKPKSLDFVKAATVPLAAASAYQALVEHANVRGGQKVLIHGGAGGIGSFAIQLAKHLGAHVASTASTDDLDFVKSLGADEAIDYKTQRFEESVKNYDVVFDTVGGETTNRSIQVLKSGGVLVSMAGQPDEELARNRGVKFIRQQSKTSKEKLQKIAQLIDRGVLHVYVDKVFPLEEASEALAYLQEGHPKGKVVIRIK
jgi:NADPH:quinone reductase-like Zn-dependent oxidoreductase